VHKNFVPQGTTVNGVFYKNVLDHLCKRIARVRLNMWKDFLLHDNVPAHTAAINTQFAVNTQNQKIFQGLWES